MKKYIISICLSITMLNALSIKNKLTTYPIDVKYMSITNGGSLVDIDAYRDGVGFFVVNDIDNSDMNENVFKYGEEAKIMGVTLVDYIAAEIGVNLSDKLKIMDSVVSNTYTVGSSCNDNNDKTINDIYINTTGTCVGTVPAVVRNSVKCADLPVGSNLTVDGIVYLVASNDWSNSNSIHNNYDKALCVSHITDMIGLFDSKDNYGGASFYTPMRLETWDTSNVVNMGSMFTYTVYFNVDISGWDTSNVTNMSYMFDYSMAFDQDISSWDVSKVSNIDSMFSGMRDVNFYTHNSTPYPGDYIKPMPNFNINLMDQGLVNSYRSDGLTDKEVLEAISSYNWASTASNSNSSILDNSAF